MYEVEEIYLNESELIDLVVDSWFMQQTEELREVQAK